MTTITNDELLELLTQLSSDDAVSDPVRQIAQFGMQKLIDAEATALIGAESYERTITRQRQRNGSRDKVLTSKTGDLRVKIPKLRTGSFFPALLKRRRRVDEALYAVIVEAYLKGISTRKMDDLARALGSDTGISKSEVSRICEQIDQQVQKFKTRKLEDSFPFMYVDATYLKCHEDGRIRSIALLVAVGIRADGTRQVLGFTTGHSENQQTWNMFFEQLIARGLSGVQLVVSDAHEGLKKAIVKHFQGAVWQRCRVHFMRNVLGCVPKRYQDQSSAWLKSIFAQPTKNKTYTTFDEAANEISKLSPTAGRLMDQAREDVLAFSSFPKIFWRQLWSTNMLERLNREIKQRSKVVSIFPNTSSIERLLGMILLEQDEEWSLRHYISQDKMTELEKQG